MYRGQRVLDLLVSGLGLFFTWPVIAIAAFAVWLGDGRSPFYCPARVGRNGQMFHIIKIRTMVVGADRVGAATARVGDPRVTRVGAFLRRTKIDELPQLWNVLRGDLSLVGPRATLHHIIGSYPEECKATILSARPGVTGVGSIVFSDLDAIMANSSDPEGEYLTHVSPWIRRFEHFYVTHASLFSDLAIVVLTALNFVDRRLALSLVSQLIDRMGANLELVRMAKREQSPLESTSMLSQASSPDFKR